MEAEDRRLTGMGSKPRYGGWAVVALVVAFAIVVAGAVITLCRRHFDWQWGRRNVWSICHEWRQRLSWLWAPREEKVGLVKAQHPTAQTVPGLYRQPGNASQNILHSDSDLRLDAQGAFTRFEAVDRDLHPPLGSANAIPPQPLRPAPQPIATGRPRPSPLQAPNVASEYLRMLHEGGPGPLTPPPVPPVPRLPGPVAHRGPSKGETVFLFQEPNEGLLSMTTTNASSLKCHTDLNPYKLSNIPNHTNTNSQFENRPTHSTPESMQLSCEAMMKSQSHSGPRVPGLNFVPRYGTRACNDETDDDGSDDDDDNDDDDNDEDDDDDNNGDDDDDSTDNDGREAPRHENLPTRDVYPTVRPNMSGSGAYRQFEMISEVDPNGVKYTFPLNGQLLIQDQFSLASLGMNNNTNRDSKPIDTTAVNEINNVQQQRKNERVNFEPRNSESNLSAHRTIMESIYGPQALANKHHHHSSENWRNDGRSPSSDESQHSVETTPHLQKSNSFDKEEHYQRQESRDTLMKAHQRVSQYIESLPDLPIVYDNPESPPVDPLAARQDEHEAIFRRLEDHRHHYHEDVSSIEQKMSELSADSPPPPPPAPPDLPRDVGKNCTPTTGERIFSALRSVTSQSYIDASEFYNSVLSSAQQQVPRFAFPTITRSSMSLIEPSVTTNPVGRRDEVATCHSDSMKRGSDLYSPELNLEAHRTAQEVLCKSLNLPHISANPDSISILGDLSQVYNSLQDPPASPLLLKDLSQEPYPYMSDPSFTRTSEDIFKSIEQRRKSMEKLNGLHETHFEMETPDGSTRRRNSQDLYAALEEVQLKRRLSQNIDDPYSIASAGWFGGLEQLSSNYGVDTIGSPGFDRRSSQQGMEPELAPDESNLRRAISCESVCSDTSVNPGDLENATVVGHVCVGLEYERWGGRGADCEGDLAVSVLEARDLVAHDGRPAQDTLARVCLLPDRKAHVQTRIYRGSPSPSYQEKFLFPFDGGPLGKTLLVQIISVEMSIGGGAFLLGEASLKLGPAPRPPATTWLPLIAPGALPFPYHGELMFSLSYLPTAERLTLVVVKARNLRGANPSVPGDFFVKVYLLQQGKKMHKKRTTVKKGEKSPIFNEAIIFSVPPHALQTVQLRLTVAESDLATQSTSKTFSVGHIIVGSTTTGKSLAHWRHMLAALRRPVAMWHPLRK